MSGSCVLTRLFLLFPGEGAVAEIHARWLMLGDTACAHVLGTGPLEKWALGAQPLTGEEPEPCAQAHAHDDGLDSPEKDVDGFSFFEHVGPFAAARSRCLLVCFPAQR